MSNITDRIISSLAIRIDAAEFAYNFNDKVFKVASWFLTLGAVKLAAEVTHSRALNFAAITLTGLFWLPIGYFLVGPDIQSRLSKKVVSALMVKLIVLGILGMWVNGRVDRIVSAIVAQHVVK